MRPIITHSRLVDNEDGKYWLNMSWQHDRTLIHMQPIFQRATLPPPPPTPAPRPVKLGLALGSGLALLLFILFALLLLCCCCLPCPLAEWRRKRRKRDKPDADLEAPLFTGATLEKPASHSNGTVAKKVPIDDVEMQSVSKFENGAPKNFLKPRSSVSSVPLTASSVTPNGFSEFASLPAGRRPSANTTMTNTRSLSRRDTNWDIQRDMVGGLADYLVECCAISSDSRLLVTATQNNPPCIWDLLSGVLLREMEGFEGEASEIFLGQNDAVLFGLFSSNSGALTVPTLKVWDFHTCSQLDTSVPILATCLCVMPSRSAALICQVGPDTERYPALVLWDLLANDEVRRIHLRKPFGMHPQAGFSFLTTSLDERFALAGFTNSQDGRSCYAVFDLLTAGNVTVNPHILPFNCRLDCSVILRNGSEACTGLHSGRLVVWSLVTGLPTRQLLSGSDSLPPHSSAIAHLVLSKDRSLLVSGDSAGVVKFWRASTEFNSAAISVPQLTCLAVSPDGYLTATGSSSGRISLWRAQGTQPVAELVINADIMRLHLSPDISSIVALNSDRRALILRLQKSSLTAHLDSVVNV